MIQKLITTSHKTATSILSIQIPAYEIEAKYINSTAILAFMILYPIFNHVMKFSMAIFMKIHLPGSSLLKLKKTKLIFIV